jgi:hypothetical protein
MLCPLTLLCNRTQAARSHYLVALVDLKLAYTHDVEYQYESAKTYL